jgi:enoyl-CoA hydratase/carnithine racemase
MDDGGSIRDIVLDKRSRKNALTLGMYAALGTALEEAAHVDQCHVVVLRSAGGAFCLGSDLNEADDAATVEAFDQAQNEFLRTLASFQKPIVAAVSGLAVGVGAAMLLHCDIVVASEFAAFEFSSAKLGRAPDALTCKLLESRIGLQRASEWLLLGERIKADEALRLGLVNAVVPLENLHGSTRARAQALAELPPRVARETKHLLHEPDRLRAKGAL